MYCQQRFIIVSIRKALFIAMLLSCIVCNASAEIKEKNFAKRGSQLLRLGRYDEAISLLSEALKQHPENNLVLYNRAAAFFRTQRYNEAFSDFSVLCRRTPENRNAWYHAAICARNLKNYTLAIIHLDKAIALLPTWDFALMERGYCYYLQRDYRSAVRDYTTALQQSPRNADAWYSLSLSQEKQQSLNEAMTSITKALEINYRNAAFRLQRGYLLLKLGEKKTEDYRNSVCESLSTRKNVKVLSKKELSKLANYPAIITDATIASSSKKIRSAALALRGYCYYLSEEYSPAIADFSRSIEEDADADEFYYRASAYARQGEQAKALVDSKKSLQLNMKNKEYRLLYGVILTELKRFDEAITIFNTILMNEPNNADALYYRASAQVEASNVGLALADLLRAVEINQNYAEAWRLLGYAILNVADSTIAQRKPHYDTIRSFPQTGAIERPKNISEIDQSKIRQAMQCFTRVVQIKCFDADAYSARASCHAMLHEYEAAIEDARRAIEYDPKNPSGYLELGMAYFAAKDIHSMFSAFKAAAKEAPNNPYARFAYGYALFVRCDSLFHAGYGRNPLIDSIASASYKEFAAAAKYDSSAETRVLQGISSFFLRQYKHAIEQLESGNDNGEPELYYRALAYAEYGKIDEAVATLRRYLMVGSRQIYRKKAATLLETLQKQ